MNGFDSRPLPRIIFGEGSIVQLEPVVRNLRVRRFLLVTDKGIRLAGHLDRVVSLLQEAGAEVAVFDEVRENPTTVDVERCTTVARSADVEAIIGLGGGSSLDTAKGCNFVLTQGGKMQDYRGFGKSTRPMLPFLAVPTTAGTGSECQSYAIISDEDTHEKMACGDLKAMASVAVLDPRLTDSQPFKVAACTGIDAVAHALESSVSRNSNAYSRVYSHKAFSLLESNLPSVLQDCPDPVGRGAMLLGASLAGLAIENSMLGCAHAAANPLTARFGLTHGHAVGLLLPRVIRFNAEDPGAHAGYAQLARESGCASADDTPEEAVEYLCGRVEELTKLCRLPLTLSACGIGREQIGQLAVDATAQWTARFNPRSAGVGDFRDLYSAVY
jgi:alcohol dehydrogenase